MDKIKDARERLLSDPISMPSWIYVAPGSGPSVVSALDYWLRAAPEKTVKGILEHHECKSPLDVHDSILGMPGVSAEYKERIQSSRTKTERQVAAIVDAMPDANLQAYGICVFRCRKPESSSRSSWSISSWKTKVWARAEGRTSLKKRWIGTRR